MMQIAKAYDTRRIEMLDAAEILFISKGYADTTIPDIIQKSNKTEDHFFNHFISKEDVMENVISRIVESGVIQAKIIAANPKYSTYQKIFLIMTAQKPSVKNNRKEMAAELHKPDNSKMHEKSLVESISKLAPILGDVVEEGVKRGELHTEYPREAMEFLLTIGQFLLDNDMFEWSQEEKIVRLNAFLDTMEKILGAKKGSFNEILELFH